MHNVDAIKAQTDPVYRSINEETERPPTTASFVAARALYYFSEFVCLGRSPIKPRDPIGPMEKESMRLLGAITVIALTLLWAFASPWSFLAGGIIFATAGFVHVVKPELLAPVTNSVQDAFAAIPDHFPSLPLALKNDS